MPTLDQMIADMPETYCWSLGKVGPKYKANVWRASVNREMPAAPIVGTDATTVFHRALLRAQQ